MWQVFRKCSSSQFCNAIYKIQKEPTRSIEYLPEVLYTSQENARFPPCFLSSRQMMMMTITIITIMIMRWVTTMTTTSVAVWFGWNARGQTT